MIKVLNYYELLIIIMLLEYNNIYNKKLHKVTQWFYIENSFISIILEF